MTFPKGLQQIVIGDDLGVKHHQDNLIVTRATRADLFVAGVWRDPCGIAHGGHVDAGHGPKLALDAPEAPHAEHCRLQARWIRALQIMAVDEVRLGRRDGIWPSGQSRSCGRHFGGFTGEKHGYSTCAEGVVGT